MPSGGHEHTHLTPDEGSDGGHTHGNNSTFLERFIYSDGDSQTFHLIVNYGVLMITTCALFSVALLRLKTADTPKYVGATHRNVNERLEYVEVSI